MSEKAHILGAGPAGMACAYYAHKKKISYNLFEGSAMVGGNCKTINFKGFKYDTGAHRFHDKNQKVTRVIKDILGDNLKEVSAPSKIFRDGEFIDFPINAVNILKKIGLAKNFKILSDNIINSFQFSNKIYSFKDLAYSSYGKTLADLFLINYTEKLWGYKADKLSPDIAGGRLKNLNMTSVIKSFFSDASVKHLDGSFLYPKNGFGEIFTTILKDLNPDSIFFNSTISNLIHEDNNIKNIVFKDGRTVKINKGETVISTLPMPLLIKGLYPRISNDIIDCVNSLKYRSLRLFVYFLDRDKFTDNASIYFPQEDIPFTRIYEPKNRSEYMAPKGKTCIVVEVPYYSNISVSDIKYNSEDIASILIDKRLICKQDIIDLNILDVPYAYPIITPELTIELQKTYDFLNNFDNLHIVGRSADFKYSHVHDLFSRAENIISGINSVNIY